MPTRLIIMTGALIAATAFAAEVAPPDKNAACMDRTVDASAGDCIIKDDGTPRHAYPPRRTPVQSSPKAPAAAPATTVRGSAAGK